MESQQTKPSLVEMAQKAMKDMDSIIKEIRQVRSNVNRLIQTAPSDKPVFLNEASLQAEAEFRMAKTDLNLWIQKHFRGGEIWFDQPDPSDQCESNEKFNAGHCHQMKIVDGGYVHSCTQPSCQHYLEMAVGESPNFNEGHAEVGVVSDNGIRWTCPEVTCTHLHRHDGEMEFPIEHAQIELEPPKYEDEIDTWTEQLREDVFAIICDELHEDASVRNKAYAEADGLLKACDQIHDIVVGAYRRRNTWTDAKDRVETAYPNC